VSKQKVLALQSRFRRATEALEFSTAGGITQANTVCPMTVEELGALIEPFVLESTPAVLTVGGRCMKLPYGFYWSNKGVPFFWTNCGHVIRFRVEDNLPYLVPGDPYCDKHHWSDVADTIGITIIDDEPYIKLPITGTNTPGINDFTNHDPNEDGDTSSDDDAMPASAAVLHTNVNHDSPEHSHH